MKLKLSLLFVFISVFSWSQSTIQTFNANGTFTVPAGVTSLSVQAWGGGGAGGGAAGAGLLFGRGAAGGGGGAFASAPISVVPASTLNVVVAGQAAGASGANGTAGGNSTITGFETSILAVGGSGGAANLGTTPAGANGGTVAASAGTIRFAGGNGGAGSSSLISLLLSSGAGGAGGNAGGAGGASISSLLLGNSPGNVGTAPGGAGSGAINSAGGASQVGGAGGAGRLVITYTCPVFSLTSTSASGICAGSGTTSTVSLTGSAASLPVGNYVVTYNRSNPSATGLTANLTVSTAGTGAFIAVGLTNVGSSTLTITKLTSASCNSNITTNNTATVTISPAPVGGTVTGGTTICSGNASGVLTLSGNVGSVVKWQFAINPFTTWTDVSNPSTINTYTSAALTQTTQFRAVVGGGSCSNVNSAATTVTVNPVPSIQLDNPSVSFCVDNNNYQVASIYYSGPQGAPTTYSIVWNSSPANSFAAVNNTALPNPGDPIKFIVPAGTSAGTYTGTLTVKNANGCVSSGTLITVTVNPVPSIQLDNPSVSFCVDNNNYQVASIYYSGPQGAPTTYSIVWNSSPANSFAAVNNTALPNPGDPIKFIIPAGTAVGTYTGTLTVKNADGCISSGTVITVNVYETGSCEVIEFRTAKNAENTVSVNSVNKVLNIDSSQRNVNQVFVYDVAGNLVYKKDAVSDSKLSINNLRSGNQVLVVKVILDNNKVVTKKVVF